MVTFHECVMAVAGNLELVENFDRLYGSSLSKVASRTPLDQMIDQATGKERADVEAFLEFVRECIYLRLPENIL